MAPSKLLSHPTLHITPEPLTAESFAPFGNVVSCPLPDSTAQIPALSSLPQHHHHQQASPPPPVVANQSTALKYSGISAFKDNYDAQCASRQPSKPVISLFACFPRELRRARDNAGALQFDVRILERHPYTTQSFIPMGLSKASDAETYYLVIVAPTLHGRTASAVLEGRDVSVRNPPDLSKLRAFIARGNQGVTYGAGTWHAPMVVLGSERVDFAVFQFANGVGEEDCQEVCFGEGLVVETPRPGKQGEVLARGRRGAKL